MPKISVIVPVYRAENYLHSCVESILNQTFRDFEIILVNDGSPDSCGSICDAFAARYPKITALHQENQGQAAARNRAMAIARGEWICFVDSDDLIHPQMLEVLYEAVEHSGAGISMCQMLESPSLPEDFRDPRVCEFETLSMEEETLVSLLDADQYPGWVACAKLIRRDLVEGYAFHVGRVYEDNEAVCRWICRAKTLAVTREKLYFYRTNPESTTQKAFSVKRLDYLWALDSIIKFYTDLGWSTMAQRFLDRYADIFASYYITCMQDLSRPDLAQGLKKDLKDLKKYPGVQMTKGQFETILDALHPKLIRFYWPLEGALRTLKTKGISGVIRKAAKVLGREERP